VKKISIVIPVCNQLGYTRICVDYIVRNTVCPFELVIVDNGSTDGTESYFSHLSSKTEVLYLRNEMNKGPILALNQGIEKSGGDMICTMHNDLVIFEAGWLSKLASVLFSENSIGLAGVAGRKGIDKKGVLDESSLVHSLRNEALNMPMHGLWDEVALLDGVMIAGRKSVFRELGSFEESYGFMHFYDLDISLKAIKAGYKNAVINIEALHINNGGITRKTSSYKKNVPDDLKLYNKNSRLFHKKWGKSFPIPKK